MKLRDFLYLQRNDRQAIFAIMLVMAVSISLIFLLGKNDSTESAKESADSINQMVAKQASESNPVYYHDEAEIHEAFPFDPNTADSTQLKRLGLKPWQIKSILHYRAKGGSFSRPTDFARVYGMTKKQFEALLPFIRIGDDFKPASDFYGNKEYYHKEYRNQESSSTAKQETGKNEKVYSYPHKIQQGQYININSADTTELMKIPGIGSYYAKRIIRYREQLGGYVSVEQLSEIEGFPESAISYMKIDAQQIQKLNINKLSIYQLRNHPYINFYQAKDIYDYRRKNGPMKSLEELKLLPNFPPDEIQRLKPYVCF